MNALKKTVLSFGLKHKELIKRIPFFGGLAKNWYRSLRRSLLKVPSAEHLCASQRLRIQANLKLREFRDVQVISDEVMRTVNRGNFNKLCDVFDWNDHRVQKTLKELGEPHLTKSDQPYKIHRKSWEYAQTVIGLDQLNCVRPDSRALSIGAGHEKLLYYFANRISKIIGIDLYDEQAWPDQEADSSILYNPDQSAPFEYRRDHLSLLKMSGCHLAFQDESFDFVYTLSSIEHFGGHQAAADSLKEIERVLKGRGIACVVTEFVLNGKSHSDFFNKNDLEKYIISSHGLRLVEPAIDFRISESSIRSYLDFIWDPLDTSPHVVLRMADTFITSIILFFRKE